MVDRMRVARLATRALLSVNGPESLSFLQSLLSNDLKYVFLDAFHTGNCPPFLCRRLASVGSMYAFLLNAKGRVVSDLLVYGQTGDEILLEADADQMDLLQRNLRLYRLRRKVDIAMRPDLDVHFVFPDVSSSPPLHAIPDPRLTAAFGSRILTPPATGTTMLDKADYLRHRLSWGLAEGGLECANQIALNVNGDFLHGISYDKGCYIGQELIARTHHTGIIRKRLIPFRTQDSRVKLKRDADVICGDGKRRGKVINAVEGIGIGVVSVDAVTKQIAMTSEGHVLQFYLPQWWPPEAT